MWANYELWFHPLSGVVLLGFVIAVGRDLAAPSSRRLRWSMGLMLVSFLALQTLSILRSVFDTRDFAHLPYTFFGISDLVAALALFSWFVTRPPRA